MSLASVLVCVRTLAFLVLLSGVAAQAQAQVSDTAPPSLVAISFAPGLADVSSAPASIVVTATATDNLSGTATITVRFTSPSGLQVAPAGGAQFLSRISGDGINGTYRGTVTLPQFAEAGLWKLSVAQLTDATGNSVALSAANLQSVGFATDLSVTSAPDTQAPQLTGLAFAPAILDVSSGSQILTADFSITDNLSGTDFTNANFEFRLTYQSSAVPAQQQYGLRTDFQLISGTIQNGVWRIRTTFPQMSAAGTWSIAGLRLTDRTGNSRFLGAANIRALGLNPDFTIISPNADATLPALTGLAFSPAVIDTSDASRAVTITFNFTDDKSGVSAAPDHASGTSFQRGLTFISPSGGQSRTSSTPALAAGTPLNGTWTATVFFPRFSEAGTWRISSVQFKDAVNNRTSRSTLQLAAAGLPTELAIFLPSQAVDGVMGSGGAVINDGVFGTRASLNIPAGVIPSGTTVAIDVLSSPPVLPTPRGFTAGTLFTNINFNPTPAMPLASPGISVVLPFSTFRTPGSAIHLYRLDGASGLLVPAVNASGANVVGTVNSDGLSARFNNVIRFSTLVGYFPTAVVGDVDGDGQINCVDLEVVRAAFGKRTGQAGYDPRADVNSNGAVDVNDLAVVSRQIPADVSCTNN